MVHIIGAGCGAADLITLRGKKHIEEADVIIYAGSLVNPEILSYAKANCEIHDSGKMTLEEIIAVIEKAEKENKITVRIQSGDPSLYGAIGEQMREFDRLGIEYDITPGVSAFSGAAAALRTEYTLPDVSQTVIITRASGKTVVPDSENLRDLASHGATMVLFLSTGLLAKVTEELIAGGCSAARLQRWKKPQRQTASPKPRLSPSADSSQAISHVRTFITPIIRPNTARLQNENGVDLLLRCRCDVGTAYCRTAVS